MPPASQHLHSRIVQSRQNSRVKELRASLSSGARSEAGRVGIEGEHLLLEAVRSGVEIATVFFRSGDEALLDRIGLDPKVDVIELPPEIFASAVATESPQGIAALVAPKVFSLDDALSGESPLVVIAAGLQDPGNLGTLIRSAEAFGASGVIALAGDSEPVECQGDAGFVGFGLPAAGRGGELKMRFFRGCDLWAYGRWQRLRDGVSQRLRASLRAR